MSAARERLPNRRPHLLLDFEHAGFRYTAGLGRFPDSRLAEIFIDSAKRGSDLIVAARDTAVVASIALQHGATVETIRQTITRNDDGSASGALGALLDLIERKPL